MNCFSLLATKLRSESSKRICCGWTLVWLSGKLSVDERTPQHLLKRKGEGYLGDNETHQKLANF